MKQLSRETTGGEALSETLPSFMAVLQRPEQLDADSSRPAGEHPEGKWEHNEGKWQEQLWFLKSYPELAGCAQTLFGEHCQMDYRVNGSYAHGDNVAPGTWELHFLSQISESFNSGTIKGGGFHL